jgi:hypothetical protein
VQLYLRTTRWLVAEAAPIKVGANCQIKRLAGTDALQVKESARMRNAFSRHAGTRDFYYQRASALEDQTVIEIRDGGVTSTQVLSQHALLAENLVAASFIMSGGRQTFLRRVVGGRKPHLDLHLFGGSRFLKASSSSQDERAPTGLRIDGAVRARYSRNGFAAVYDLAVTNTELASRIRSALNWLLASRTDPDDSSALVKTATALESLLVIGKEPPTRTLSERAAYLLSDVPDDREKVSKAMHRFYEVRGELVHGKRVKDAGAIAGAVEFGDRMVVLIALGFGAQAAWTSANDVQKYCDGARWGHRWVCTRPWLGGQVRLAMDRMHR